MKTTIVGVATLLLVGSVARGVVFSSVPFTGPSVGIPDWDPNGVANSLTVTTPGTVLVSLTIQLSISGRGEDGSYNGDLYAYVKHNDTIAILLNRPGKTADDDFGYADSQGFQVTFDDSALGGNATGTQDIHIYRRELSLSGTDDSTPLTGPLTGVWRPDARAADPDDVVDSTPRTAGLGGFAGIDPNGTWTLFLADLGQNGLAQLDSWAISGVAVPEVPASSLLTAVALGAFALSARQWRVPKRLAR